MNTTVTHPTLDNTPQPFRRRWLRWLLSGLSALVVIVVVLFGLMIWWMSYVPADLDTATTQSSQNGFFSGSYTPDLTPLRINQIHAWTVHLTNGDGQALDGAQITVDGGMPQHGHGLPTSPQETNA